MRDYSNMPKLEWHDDKVNMARIKTQIMREDPIILIMPPGYNFDLDSTACDCEASEGRILNCDPASALSSLAKLNSDTALEDIGTTAQVAGLIVDIDAANGQLIVHD